LPTQRVIATGEDRPLGGDVVVDTTPIAVPVSATIGEPDIPRGRSAAWVIHSGPPKWRMVQENHRPSSDSRRADAQKFTGCRTRSAIGSAVAVAVSAL
jgi:hypothetical protein